MNTIEKLKEKQNRGMIQSSKIKADGRRPLTMSYYAKEGYRMIFVMYPIT